MKVLRNTMIFWFLVIVVVTILEAGQIPASIYQVEKTPISNSAYLTKPFFREKRNANLIPFETECVFQLQHLQDKTKARRYRYELENCKFLKESKKDWQTEFKQWKNVQEAIEQKEMRQHMVASLSTSDREQYFQGRAEQLSKQLELMEQNRQFRIREEFDRLNNHVYNLEISYKNESGLVGDDPDNSKVLADDGLFRGKALVDLNTLLEKQKIFEKEDLSSNFLKTVQTIKPLVKKPAVNSASSCTVDSVRFVLPRNVFVLLLASAVSLIGAANVLKL